MLPYHSPTSTWTLHFEEEEARQGHGPSLESCLASLCPVHGLALNRKGGPGVLGERRVVQYPFPGFSQRHTEPKDRDPIV